MSLGLKNFFGLDRNETIWFGLKLRNDSENFGLIRNEFQSETFTRDISRFYARLLKIKTFFISSTLERF